MHIQCTYSNFGRKITKYTVIYGAYIQLWPTLCILYAAFCTQVGSGPLQKGVLIRRPHTQQALAIKTKESFALLCARIPAPPSLYSLTHEHHFEPSGHHCPLCIYSPMSTTVNLRPPPPSLYLLTHEPHFKPSGHHRPLCIHSPMSTTLNPPATADLIHPLASVGHGEPIPGPPEVGWCTNDKVSITSGLEL